MTFLHLSRIRRTLCALGLVASVLAANPLHAFQLQSMDAARVNLNDHLGDGRWKLVMFWSTDCIPCEQQKPMIEAFNQAHQNTDASVVGIALDGIDNISAIENLVERHQPSYPNLVVFTDVFHRQYLELTGKQFRATPTYLLFDPDGELAGVRTGSIERDMLESILAGN